RRGNHGDPGRGRACPPISRPPPPGAGYIRAMLPVLLAALAHAAEPYAGVEWRPLSRADLAWVEEGRTSGAGVGELDGTVRPALQAHGGLWLGERVALGG